MRESKRTREQESKRAREQEKTKEFALLKAPHGITFRIPSHCFHVTSHRIALLPHRIEFLSASHSIAFCIASH
jgi:hypothetical protein